MRLGAWSHGRLIARSHRRLVSRSHGRLMTGSHRRLIAWFSKLSIWLVRWIHIVIFGSRHHRRVGLILRLVLVGCGRLMSCGLGSVHVLRLVLIKDFVSRLSFIGSLHDSLLCSDIFYSVRGLGGLFE